MVLTHLALYFVTKALRFNGISTTDYWQIPTNLHQNFSFGYHLSQKLVKVFPINTKITILVSFGK